MFLWRGFTYGKISSSGKFSGGIHQGGNMTWVNHQEELPGASSRHLNYHHHFDIKFAYNDYLFLMYVSRL